MDNNLTNTTCWKCRKDIDAMDRYCKHCGAGQNDDAKFSHSLLAICLMYFIIGPLNLFRLWKSPIIKKEVKGIATIAILFVTIFLIYSVMAAVGPIIAQYNQALQGNF